jgi:hypothetical protein
MGLVILRIRLRRADLKGSAFSARCKVPAMTLVLPERVR